jgi:hypothetical protein
MAAFSGTLVRDPPDHLLLMAEPETVPAVGDSAEDETDF